MSWAALGVLEVKGGYPSSLFSSDQATAECWAQFKAPQYKQGMDPSRLWHVFMGAGKPEEI